MHLTVYFQMYLGLSTGRVCAQSGTAPTRSGPQNFNPSPTEVLIGSGGSELPQSSGGSVGVDLYGKRRETGEEKMKKAEIRRIFFEKLWKSGQIQRDLDHFRQDLG